MQAYRNTPKQSGAASLRTVMQGSSYLPLFSCHHELSKHRLCSDGHGTHQCTLGQSSTLTWLPQIFIQDCAQHITKSHSLQNRMHSSWGALLSDMKANEPKQKQIFFDCTGHLQLVTINNKKLWAGSPLGDAAQTDTMQLQRAGTM